VGALLDDLARQTVRPQILIVDSGSTDGTRALVAGRCDHLIALPRETYRPGRSLNAGAGAASAPVHFAVSSHCRLPRDDFIERSLALYEDERVAGTNGSDRTPDLHPLTGRYVQTAEDMLRRPFWGFSNHASSWRASVWRSLPFSEELVTAEDKEWALRVLRAGWTLAYHPDLLVDQSHRWRRGAREFYRRSRIETYVLGRIVDLPAYGPADVAREWWRPPDPRTSLLRLRLSPRRMTGLVGGWAGRRQARHDGGAGA
jgi:rhamnosyltransferase